MAKLAQSTKEDLVRIVPAPVPSEEGFPTKELTNDQFNNRFISYGGCGYLLKSAGGCLSFLSKTFLCSHIASEKEVQLEDCREARRRDLSSIARSLNANGELAILVSILEKATSLELYNLESLNPHKYESVKERYLKNCIMIDELQEGCFGSVSEQIESFQTMMPHFFKRELVQGKIEKIDSIILGRRKKKEEAFQHFLAIGGFAVSTMLTLPVIHETTSIFRDVLRSCFPFDKMGLC